MVPPQEVFVRRMKKTAFLDLAPEPEKPSCARITGAAFEAFMEKGYAGTSTLEIATRAKISKRDLYANFANKREILLACVASRAARMRLPSDLPAPHSRDMLVSILTRFGAIVVREVCQPEVIAMFRLAISEAERSPEVAETLNASRSVNRDALAELLAGAQAVGLLRDGDPRQMMERFYALLWGDLMIGRLLSVKPPPEPAEIDRRAHEAAEALLKLCGSPNCDGR
jgi:AcrR family transcriptional regulator